MRSLKLLVIVLGILIIAAVATIMITLVNRAGGGSDAPWARTLQVPAEATIRDYRLDGDRLVIRLAVPGKPDEFRILDLTRGRPVGAVTLKPQ
jgi:hypothetical protein